MKIKHILNSSAAIVLVISILSSINHVNTQGAEDELAEVTIEMFTALQLEIQDLYSQLSNLQSQLDTLASNIQNLATNNAVVGTVELAELQSLIEASNRQDDDITKLVNSNGIWQQNFRVINNTFERLRKVVVFPIPILNSPPPVPASVRRNLPSIKPRANVTIVQRQQRITTTSLQRGSTNIVKHGSAQKQQRMKNSTSLQNHQSVGNIQNLQRQQTMHDVTGMQRHHQPKQ